MICPNCKRDMMRLCYPTYPPKYGYECFSCGKKVYEEGDLNPIVSRKNVNEDPTPFVKSMPDIVEILQVPGSFKDKLNDLMAKGKKKDISKIVLRLKEEILDYVATNAAHMNEKSVELRIEGGQVMPQYRGEVPGINPICGVDVLPDVTEKFKEEGFMLEYAYDRGKLNGKLIFRW